MQVYTEHRSEKMSEHPSSTVHKAASGTANDHVKKKEKVATNDIMPVKSLFTSKDNLAV